MKPHFDIAFLPQAEEFMDRLNDKAREKVYYNMKKSQFVQDDELLKKLNEHIWEFRTLYNGIAYRLFAFWINQVEKKHSLLRRTASLKKSRKHPSMRLEKPRRSE